MANGKIEQSIKELSPSLNRNNTSGGTMSAYQIGKMVFAMFSGVHTTKGIEYSFLSLCYSLPQPKTPNTFQPLFYTNTETGATFYPVRCGINASGELSVWGVTLQQDAVISGCFIYEAA